MATPKKKIRKLPETEDVRNIRECCKELLTKGWTTMTATYQGYGDSCESFAVSLANEETSFEVTEVPAAMLPPGCSTAELENHLLSLLPAGFENNEGGDGEITVDIKTGAIHVSHNEYYTDSRNEEWRY